MEFTESLLEDQRGLLKDTAVRWRVSGLDSVYRWANDREMGVRLDGKEEVIAGRRFRLQLHAFGLIESAGLPPHALTRFGHDISF